MNRIVYLKTTESCNLSCKHCFTGGDNPPRFFWKDEQLKEWISRFLDYIPVTDDVHFELHGGEPMLAPVDSISSMVEYIRSKSINRSISVGMTTNLVYKLNEKKVNLFKSLDGLGTSWDPEIRFTKDNQYKLWRENVDYLHSLGLKMTLFISVSRKVTEMNQEDLLKFIKELGFFAVQFERITGNGNALHNRDLFPSNKEINNWYLNLHNATVNLNAREWFINTTLEDVYAKFEKLNMCSGTFCRDCQERLLTINANGSIAGCPNSAPTEFFGHISQPLDDMFTSNRRTESIINEKMRNPNCYQCPVFKYCGSDCHKLDWEEIDGRNVCPAPKSLMFTLKKQKDEYVERRLKELQQTANTEKPKMYIAV